MYEYGFSEDYRQLAAYDRGATFSRLMIAEGRPGFALWARLVFGAAGGIASLGMVRLLNITALAVLAILFSLAWRRAGLGRWDSALAGVAALTLPPFQLFAATAAMGAVAVGAICGAAAAILTRAGTGARTAAQRHAVHVSSLLVLIAGLATYQSTGLMYFVFAAIFLIAANPPRDVWRRMAAGFAVIGALGMGAEFAIFRLGKSAFPSELIDAPRADLLFDPAGKAFWFLTFPLPHALNLWKLYPNLTFALAMLIVLVAGLVLHVRGKPDWWARFAVLLVLPPLCYVPNLAVVESRSSFRSQPALVAIVFAYYLIVVHDQFAITRRWIYRIVLVAFTAVGLTSAAYNVTVLIARPQARELEIVRERLGGLPQEYTTVAVMPADYHDALAPAVFYDEFGYPSTALMWSAYELTWLVLHELHPGSDSTALRVLPADGMSVEADTVLDWGATLRAARTGRPPAR